MAPRSRPRKKIVVIGGGTGTFTVLSGLKRYPFDLTAVVSMADDGGSTGFLRDELGVLPPGDIRRAIVALSETDSAGLARLFTYRFSQGKGLKGHNLGNLIISALEDMTGSFSGALEEIARMLALKGHVVPVTLAKTRLRAELEDGRVVRGERNIDVPKHNGDLKIERVWLQPAAKANPEALRAIREADLVVLAPGDLYTSLVPNLLVQGIPEALQRTSATVAYCANLMTKFGETNGFMVSDFLRAVESYAGRGAVDYLIVNNRRPRPERLKPYRAEKAEWVPFDRAKVPARVKPMVADLLRPRGFIRHDPARLAALIAKLAARA